MLTMHPTLLIGPGDWDPRRMPQEEYATRVARLWQAFPDAAGAIVFGSSHDHAALAYLTHFTPKLEPAIALIPRRGAPRLMVGGGANMLPAARPLTWISDLVSLRPTGKTIAQWLAEFEGPCLCIGCDSMPSPMHRELEAALGGRKTDDGTGTLGLMMQRKSARERACVREAAATLAAAAAAMTDARRAGAGVTAVVLAGEHEAIRRGAQDVRTLFSLDGGRTLRPFTEPVERPVDPLQAYIAVRQFGYWTEAFVRLSDETDDAAARARDTLGRVIAAAGLGRTIAAPAQAMRIGLAADEGPAAALDAGGVYSIRVAVDGATVSAMLAASDGDIELLWSGG